MPTLHATRVRGKSAKKVSRKSQCPGESSRITPGLKLAACGHRAGRRPLVEIDGERVAAFRDEAGELSVLSPVCTHLKCLVHWNGAERTWDCPCHGSRFATDGEVLEGPALAALKPIAVRESS